MHGNLVGSLKLYGKKEYLLETIPIENLETMIFNYDQIGRVKRTFRGDTWCQLLTETLYRSKDIKSLEIMESELTSIACQHIGKGLFGCTRLENDYSLQDSEATEDKQFPRLETLNLPEIILTKQDLRAIVRADRLIFLKNLVLRNINLSGCLGELLGPGFPSLVRIFLSCEQLTSDDIGSLVKALRRKRLPRLKHLDFKDISTYSFLIQEYDSGDEDCANSSLEVMDFSYSTVSPDNIVRIMHGAAPLSRLRKLNLAHVHLCGSLRNVLAVPQKVTNFQNSSSNDSELPTTSKVVAQFQSLRDLGLSCTGINGDDLSAIASAVINGSLPRLSCLDLCGNDFSGLESSVESVIQACQDYYLSNPLELVIGLHSFTVEFRLKIRDICKDSKVRLY